MSNYQILALPVEFLEHLKKNMSNFEETFNFLTYATPRGQAVWSALVKINDLRDLSYI